MRKGSAFPGSLYLNLLRLRLRSGKAPVIAKGFENQAAHALGRSEAENCGDDGAIAMAPEKSTFGTKRIREAQRLRSGVVMKVRRKIVEFAEVSRAAIARAIGTYYSEAVPKFLYLTVESIQT